jgi:hypothetical protein
MATSTSIGAALPAGLLPKNHLGTSKRPRQIVRCQKAPRASATGPLAKKNCQGVRSNRPGGRALWRDRSYRLIPIYGDAASVPYGSNALIVGRTLDQYFEKLLPLCCGIT